MEIEISSLPAEPEAFTIETGDDAYVFRFASGGSARVERQGDTLILQPKRSASHRTLMALLG